MSLQEGTEDQTVEEVCHRIIRDLAVSTVGVSTVAEAVTKSYTDLPTSKEAIGNKQSEDLTKARENMTKNLVLFRDLHLPLGNEVVNDLVETLDFFSVDDFDQFKALIPVVLEQVQEAEDRATFVRELYDKLTTDLEKLGEDALKALKAAEGEAKVKLDTAKAKGRAAKIIGGVAGATVTVGVGGGLMLAASLMGPGGLLFYPALAETALIAGSAMGVAAASGPALAAAVVNHQSNRALITHGVLKKSTEAYRTVFTVALSQFAASTHGFAGFFQTIRNQLVNVEKNLGRMEKYRDGALRALYSVVRNEAAKLREACEGYVNHSTQVRIRIGVLDRFNGECYRSYIDEWYQNCPSDKKALASMQALVKKVFSGRRLH